MARGFGSMITARRLSGLGNLKNPSSFVGAAIPAALGPLTAGGTSLALRQFIDPTKGAAQKAVFKHAPWIGLGVNALASLALMMLGGTPAAIVSFTSGLLTSTTLFVADLQMKQRHGYWVYAMADSAAAGAGAAGAGVAGLGVIVPEYSRGVAGALPSRGMGATVMEPSASRGYGMQGAYGETVNLRGVNPGSFGTPGFNL